MAEKKTAPAAESVDLAEVQAMIAKMLADAKAEAQKIVDEAKAATGAKTSGMTAEERAAHKAYMNELVDVKLFKDNDRYRDDVYVAVNGQNCIIKRGEWVRIKRKFALVLDASEIQDMKTGEFMEREQSRFMNESSAR